MAERGRAVRAFREDQAGQEDPWDPCHQEGLGVHHLQGDPWDHRVQQGRRGRQADQADQRDQTDQVGQGGLWGHQDLAGRAFPWGHRDRGDLVVGVVAVGALVEVAGVGVGAVASSRPLCMRAGSYWGTQGDRGWDFFCTVILWVGKARSISARSAIFLLSIRVYSCGT